MARLPMPDKISADTSMVACEDCGRLLRDPVSRARRRGPVCQAQADPPPTRPEGAFPAVVRSGYHRGQVAGQAMLLDELPDDDGDPEASIVVSAHGTR